eukprot:TRINITY_DN13833_c0_g2_i1.p1 TRINITY_DN13833_c0_g2~~TRINITY_DN13833_c0_g2_i1.p1  ORF type:complete len:307 (+),score=12.72 TRINITY_DN13833_c0_g2_i1:39-959(+)
MYTDVGGSVAGKGYLHPSVGIGLRTQPRPFRPYEGVDVELGNAKVELAAAKQRMKLRGSSVSPVKVSRQPEFITNKNGFAVGVIKREMRPEPRRQTIESVPPSRPLSTPYDTRSAVKLVIPDRTNSPPPYNALDDVETFPLVPRTPSTSSPPSQYEPVQTPALCLGEEVWVPDEDTVRNHATLINACKWLVNAPLLSKFCNKTAAISHLSPLIATCYFADSDEEIFLPITLFSKSGRELVERRGVLRSRRPYQDHISDTTASTSLPPTPQSLPLTPVPYNPVPHDAVRWDEFPGENIIPLISSPRH